MSNQVIDLQYIIEGYTREQKRELMNGQNRVIKTRDICAHVLLVPDESSPITYRVRYGGTIVRTTEIKGWYIPLLFNYAVPLREGNDHIFGCKDLDYSKNPNIVKTYVEKMTALFNRKEKNAGIYLDPGLKFTIPKEMYGNIFEGILPVKVTGTSICGPEFNDTLAFIITGNCS